MGDAADDAERRAQREAEEEGIDEVVYEEPAAEARNLPAVRAHEAVIARAEITPEEVKAQRDKIVEVMRSVMTEDQHYGRIPGVNKPTLLKPGAELLAVTLRLAPHYKSERIFHDDGHLTVISNVTLVHITSGLTIAEGEGLCTSREKKYAYRGAGRTCPTCGAVGTIKKSKFPPRPNDYEGAADDTEPGWYCYAKVGGCGANFAAHDSRITDQSEEPIPNPDIADTFNTVLKMANKRALIAAILNGTAASDIFTQDMEDSPQAQSSGSSGQQSQARQETTRRVEEVDQVKTPRDWATLIGAMQELLGEHEAMEWLRDAKEIKEMADLPAPTLFQRLVGAYLDLMEHPHGPGYEFMPNCRAVVSSILSARLDNNVPEGPEWYLGPGDEEGRPSREEVLEARAATDGD